MQASPKIDFFDDPFGRRRSFSYRNRNLGPFLDPIYQAALLANPAYRALGARARATPIQRVLLSVINVPGREADLKRLVEDFCQTRHQVTVTSADLKGGKFENVNTAIAPHDLSRFDWLISMDDDITLPRAFLDRFLCVAVEGDLSICQPAHCIHSWATFDLTLRSFRTIFRTTRYVESGPLTAFRSNTFPWVLPFPASRWAWGTDLFWSKLAMTYNWQLGIVDATPIHHLRRPGNQYSVDAAREEAQQLLASNNISLGRPDVLVTVAKHRSLP